MAACCFLTSLVGEGLGGGSSVEGASDFRFRSLSRLSGRGAGEMSVMVGGLLCAVNQGEGTMTMIRVEISRGRIAVQKFNCNGAFGRGFILTRFV